MDAKQLSDGLPEFAAWGTLEDTETELKVHDKGSGNWSSKKLDKGRYLITVNGSFGGPPVVVVSRCRADATKPDPSDDNRYTTHVVNKEAFEVYSLEGGERKDGTFSFFAIWRLG